MKMVCSVVNETKRRVEKLEEIMDWQHTVEGWEVCMWEGCGRCVCGRGVGRMGGVCGRGVGGVWEVCMWEVGGRGEAA